MTLNDMRSKTLGDILQDCDITGVKFEGNGSIDKIIVTYSPRSTDNADKCTPKKQFDPFGGGGGNGNENYTM